MKKTTANQSGFSMLELLITLTIISIVLAFVIPSNQFFLSKAKDQVSSSQLLRAISLARSEAQLRGQAITLCKSADHTTCSGEWQNGFIAFVDEQETGTLTEKDNIIAIFNPISQDGVLHWRSSLNRSYLQILPSGYTPGENGTFWFCPAKTSQPTWAVVINQLGRARLVYPDQAGKRGSLHCDNLKM